MTSWKQQFIFGIEKMGDDTSWESSGFGAWTGFWSDGDGKSLNAGCGVRNEEYEYTECNTCVSLQSSNAVRLESQAGRKTIQPENCIVIVPDMHSMTYASALVAHRVGGGIPILVHRLADSIHASFRPCLATTPLRFTRSSPPSG